MTCCLCNELKWIACINNTYYFDMLQIEDLHWRLGTDLTTLTEMIGLLQSFQKVKDNIESVIMSYHKNCNHTCSLCGHTAKVTSTSSDHTSIIERATQYYSGLTDEQWSILSKLNNCTSEMQVIDGMIGMQGIKGEFVRLLKFLASIEPEELRKNSHLMHMVITGPPGHGKTEIAKLLGNAFKKSGLLTSDKFVLATRADLIGMYC